MATSTITEVNEGVPWLYYIRQAANSWKIGIVNKTGSAISTANVDIQIYFKGLPEDATDEDAILPIPRNAELDFAKGIAFDILQTEGVTNREYKSSFEDCVRKMKRRVLRASYRPANVKPIKMY